MSSNSTHFVAFGTQAGGKGGFDGPLRDTGRVGLEINEESCLSLAARLRWTFPASPNWSCSWWNGIWLIIGKDRALSHFSGLVAKDGLVESPIPEQEVE
jgi:hypothetical protein